MRNITKANAQNLINTKTSDFFVFGQEKIDEFDNAMNSFVGCCSLGTGHLDSLIITIMEMLNHLHYSRMIQDHNIFLFLVGKYSQLNHRSQVMPIWPRLHLLFLLVLL